MAVSVTRTEFDAEGLRHAATRAKDAAAARRMRALALVLDGRTGTEAAETCGMDRQTLRDWVHRYNDQGVAGLSDRKAAGPTPRLTVEQQAEVAALVRSGPDLAEQVALLAGSPGFRTVLSRCMRMRPVSVPGGGAAP